MTSEHRVFAAEIDWCLRRLPSPVRRRTVEAEEIDVTDAKHHHINDVDVYTVQSRKEHNPKRSEVGRLFSVSTQIECFYRLSEKLLHVYIR